MATTQVEATIAAIRPSNSSPGRNVIRVISDNGLIQSLYRDRRWPHKVGERVTLIYDKDAHTLRWPN